MNTIKKILLYVKLAFYTKTGIILSILFATNSIVYCAYAFYYLNVNLVGMLIDSPADMRGGAIGVVFMTCLCSTPFMANAIMFKDEYYEKKREQISRQLQNLQQSNKHHNQWSEEDEL